MTQLGDRVSQARADIRPLQIGKIRQNFIFVDAIGEHLQNIDDANSHAANAWAAVALVGPDSDAGCQT